MDTFSSHERSAIMRRVHGKDTVPEIQVRSILHRLGFRYALHKKDLPGAPDIVLTRHRTVVFVNGCFWHRHRGCKRASTPASRQDYWLPKFERTIARDKSAKRLLRKLGWRVIIVWECELRDPDRLRERLRRISTREEGLL